MAVGIAKLKPRSFVRFHDWLMAGDKDKPPELEKIIPKAYTLVDSSRLRELSRSQEVNKQIAEYIDLLDTLRRQKTDGKQFGLPAQILGDYVLSGTVEDPDDVFRAWEEHLGVKPR
jgi:hypothetical protein